MTHTDQHLAAIVEVIAPQGRFGLIDDPDTLDVMPFKLKSISIHWELMYTRSLFQTADMDKQGKALAEVATEVNDNVENIGARRLHTILERVLDEVSFAAADRKGETVTIDADYVRRGVGDLAKDADLSKFIL